MGKKGNILGDPFKDFVRKQINQRQESLGKYTNIENKDLLYYNSKTPWLRLASSIDINSDSQKAKDYILQGGVVNYTSGKKNNDAFETGDLTPMKSGIGVGGAYKFLKDEDRGNVPLPGITSADVKYENNGALTLTTVKIKCFSRAQLNIIDKLYLRPGFSMLLEFGWSVYLDNDGILQTFDEFTTPPLDSFMNGTKDQYGIQEEIEKEQEKHCGNYEAILGVVTNFSWDIQNDGTYDCMIEMSGVGEVIETIGVEQRVKEKDIIKTPKLKDLKRQQREEELSEFLGFDFNASKIHNWLSHIHNTEYEKSYLFTSYSGSKEYMSSINVDIKLVKALKEDNKYKYTFKTPLPTDNLQTSTTPYDNFGTGEGQEVWSIKNRGQINIWVRFGRLLEFIEGNLLGNDKNNNPFPRFDLEHGTPYNTGGDSTSNTGGDSTSNTQEVPGLGESKKFGQGFLNNNLPSLKGKSTLGSPTI